MNNLPSSIRDKLDRDLHKEANHPIEITKRLVYDYFEGLADKNFKKFEDFPKVVSIRDNFDLLRIPIDHPARSKSDTFYIDNDTVLRTHTTAHQNEILRSGIIDFLVVGDVYRRDAVDRTHYPIFHQLEGVTRSVTADPIDELKALMHGLAKHLFPHHDIRISPDYFPFTEPSFEVEVRFADDWLEILGCGIVHEDIRNDLDISYPLLAWGIGLERLAMILFSIPDIRLFWTRDEKFIHQFIDGKVTKFVSYSNLDPIDRDVSFWLPENSIVSSNDSQWSWTDLNPFLELVRDLGDDTVESIELYDKFIHPKTNRKSHTFHIRFSPISGWTDGAKLVQHANRTTELVREQVADKFNVELR